MDPIREGSLIFSKLASNISTDEVRDINLVYRFLIDLISNTNGLVMLDFLDTSGWDRLTNIHVDVYNNYLYLIWYQYSEENEIIEYEIGGDIFSSSFTGLFMHFQSMKIIQTRRFPAFILQGYAFSEKELKKIFFKNTEKFEFRTYNNFSTDIVRKTNKKTQEITCINTPFHSILILPKDRRIDSHTSKKILYDYNFKEALHRIKKVKKELIDVEKNDFDVICEKSNTVRRILENILKIESCHRDVKLKKPYSQVLLGDLNSVLKGYHQTNNSSIYDTILTTMIIWTNELSHDSGLPIDKDKAVLLCSMLERYIYFLKEEIKNEYRLLMF